MPSVFTLTGQDGCPIDCKNLQTRRVCPITFHAASVAHVRRNRPGTTKTSKREKAGPHKYILTLSFMRGFCRRGLLNKREAFRSRMSLIYHLFFFSSLFSLTHESDLSFLLVLFCLAHSFSATPFCPLVAFTFFTMEGGDNESAYFTLPTLKAFLEACSQNVSGNK